ncbi:Succinylglutamate desuccinylase / Aspartoacylase family protein [Gimesia maris]|uniref:succinylglutamate desuccinylase/aspartoacylase family protein n=1 Tax=Gimesia maris TaxID=122 RepID=UPI00118971BF|nr:succinylglutamate desuccinylase/aspartoacylase family protein [Gimesia maris]QDT78290.1 Succinylglutamate desuccinylase / Aspartoacylase family protein [Gimesia maris]QDU13884.1 Succinylglutamate desuccinylase / Aspartoacylase family protein [Gimesia maris]|tara:strand:- start:257901 stop:259061 length:1161 start_codon:yes stop_codon:yes gene_type:complete
MTKPRRRKPIDQWNGESIPAGQSRDVKLAVSESYSSMNVKIPIHIRRAEEDGPVVFVTAALHGDEINGTGAIRELIQDVDFQLLRGSVILVPVLNILAFDRHSRYLPDRRDLNRSFPGSANGSLASRMARIIFEEIVSRCDYGIDLHTASVRRTNYPNVRGDLSNPEVSRLAKAFGSEIIMNGKGPAGAFRREACNSGCPTIIMEGGEVWKVEPGIVESAARGVRNVLRDLQMLDGEPESPDYQVIVDKSTWVRAERGGFLKFHVKPGDIIEKDQPLATNTTLLGRERSMLYAPFDSVVIGMTTLPAISPGEPICNLGMLPEGTKPSQIRRFRREEDGLEGQVVEELSTNLVVVEPCDEAAQLKMNPHHQRESNSHSGTGESAAAE